ncbi:MAG: divalent metal cation transporter [Planctomycetota bacterium]
MAETAESSSAPVSDLDRDRQLLAEAEQQGVATRLKTYARLSGPAWLQSAITLGGGSLGSSLYLGVLGGFSLMWLQPLAMILGVVMLSVIGYVTLSTGQRPFPAINRHVNPMLGWSWALAVAIANVIWCMPQHSLSYDVLSTNLLPSGCFGAESVLVTWATATFGEGAFAANFDKLLVGTVILVFCTVVTWSYDRGGWGIRLYETILKIVVAVIVLCFFCVVMRLTFSAEPLDWGAVAAGLAPDFGQLFRPADSFVPLLDAVGAVGTPARDYWQQQIVASQRDVIISAAATAVGINMTFMYPYSMLRKGWTKEFRGLARFDLATGMFVPFVLATGCVVIAAAAAFHTKLPTGFAEEADESGAVVLRVDETGPKFGAFKKSLDQRNEKLDDAAGELADAERRLAAMLVKRDALDMAKALEPLTGPGVANYLFGFGVLAMVLSTISVLMLMSGTVIAEMLALPPGGWAHKLGTLVAGVGGVLWPLFWAGDSKFYLVVVTSVFGFMLLPFAYVTFAALLNSRSLLGDEMPRGASRFFTNALAFTAATLATLGAVYMVHVKGGVGGLVAMAGFVLLTIVVAVNRSNTRRIEADAMGADAMGADAMGADAMGADAAGADPTRSDAE